jgi:radical SAM protein (TIGR01212 family)
VYRVGLHAGFTCPNRDGTLGTGGCTYCVNESFSAGSASPPQPIRDQMIEGMTRARRRRGVERFFAYFQSFTNTYADVDTLRARYDEALAFPDVVGLAIGTRPDCVPEDVLDLIETYAERLEVWVEYGLQSAHDRTLRAINRGHDVVAFRDAVARARGRGIRVCAHVILGLPGETHDDMMATADALAAMGVDGVKLHHLHIVRGSGMEANFRAGRVPVLSVEDYVLLACDFLERIPKDVVVFRLMGDVMNEADLIAPRWRSSKAEVLRRITDTFRSRRSAQGVRAPRHKAAHVASR